MIHEFRHVHVGRVVGGAVSSAALILLVSCSDDDGSDDTLADAGDGSASDEHLDASEGTDTDDVEERSDVSGLDADVDEAQLDAAEDALDEREVSDASEDTGAPEDALDEREVSDASEDAGATEVTDTETVGDVLDATEVSDVPSDAAAGDVTDEEAEVVVELEFVRVESGVFEMGSPEDEGGRFDNEAQHSVELTRPFLIQVTEVTQSEYKAVMGSNPSRVGCAECPVDGVNWFDAIAFANALSRLEGLPECYDLRTGDPRDLDSIYDCAGYRLPTEAEWEYAARAGTTTPTYAGELTEKDCSDTTLREIAWFCGNAEGMTHPVGSLRANPWGLHDMLGNVWEWTHDRYTLLGADAVDPEGPETGTRRVLRGGGFPDPARSLRAASRWEQSSGGSFIGFRLARTAP